jgi:hypothetical protein
MREAAKALRAAEEAIVQCRAAPPWWHWDRLVHGWQHRREKGKLRKAKERFEHKQNELSLPEGEAKRRAAKDAEAARLDETRRQLLREAAAVQAAQANLADVRRQLQEAEAAELEQAELRVQLAAIEDAEHKARFCASRRASALAAQVECERLTAKISSIEEALRNRAGLEKELQLLLDEGKDMKSLEHGLNMALRAAHSDVAVAEGDLLLLGKVRPKPPETQAVE